MEHEVNKLLKTGEFAKYTGVSIRTLRHYDEIGILKPSHRTEMGHRIYYFDDFLENDVEPNWKVLNNVIKAVNMEKYYSNRAGEYENVYNRNNNTRQQGQNEIKEKLKEIFRNKNVLEVACGTGYWTEIISQVAAKLTTTDISEETLIEARKKKLEYRNVDLKIADAYRLDKIEGEFNAACANFWFSHIPKSRIVEFIEGLNKRLGKGSIVFMADNVYISGIGGELISKHDEEDTYKVRELLNGDKYEILKNYYLEDDLKNIFGQFSDNLQIKIGSCFWWIWYTIK